MACYFDLFSSLCFNSSEQEQILENDDDKSHANDDKNGVKQTESIAIKTPSSLYKIFKLKQTQRQTAVDLIMSWLLDIMNNPNNKKLHCKSQKILEKEFEHCPMAFELLCDIGFDSTSKQIGIKIENEKDEKLKYLCNIYNILFYKNSERGLVHRQGFDCRELMKTHPPKYRDGRKKAVFKKIVPNGADDCFGNMIYAQHRLIDLPETIPDPTHFVQKQLSVQPDIFNYVSNDADLSKLHFYVNFADVNLFGFYDGNLFAQDEVMTLEHPILCSLREKLKYEMNKDKESKLNIFVRGSIIILNAIKHGHFSQRKLAKLYGNRFGGATTNTVMKSVEICKPPVVDNIICIASVQTSASKPYKQTEIEKLLKTAYCGFNGAVCESLNEAFSKKESRKKVIIHTGNWGCGAFGGNIIVHTMIQIIAAVAAGVDEMVYHSVDVKSMKKVKERCKIILEQLLQKCKTKSGRMNVKKFVSELVKLKMKWGTPNGT